VASLPPAITHPPGLASRRVEGCCCHRHQRSPALFLRLSCSLSIARYL
jgi:hypothetical protein